MRTLNKIPCLGTARTEFLEFLASIGYEPYIEKLIEEPYYGESWAKVEKSSSYPEKINVPVLMVTGWYDHNLMGVLQTLRDLEARSEPTVRDQHKVLIGPWTHGRHTLVGLTGEYEINRKFPCVISIGKMIMKMGCLDNE